MRAKFVGKNSMGFKHGIIYNLRSEVRMVPGVKDPCICLYDTNSRVWCPYSNMENLLKNWNFYLQKYGSNHEKNNEI